jgi:hypothetical protein
VYNYFASLPEKDLSSVTAHAAAACFLGASQTTMLKWLGEEYRKGVHGQELHMYWYHTMESKEGRKSRQQFFSEVVEQANLASHYIYLSSPSKFMSGGR